MLPILKLFKLRNSFPTPSRRIRLHQQTSCVILPEVGVGAKRPPVGTGGRFVVPGVVDIKAWVYAATSSRWP
jgi:hypothetical protein